MTWVYVLEVNGAENSSRNKPLFQLLQELKIDDDQCFFDAEGSNGREEREELLNKIGHGDTLLVRSIVDLADSADDLIDALSVLSEKKVTLCSYEEPYLSEEQYLKQVMGVISIYHALNQKKQNRAFKQAVSEGKVGRPPKVQNIEDLLILYQSNQVSMEQLQVLTGLSKSTLYRYIKNK